MDEIAKMEDPEVSRLFSEYVQLVNKIARSLRSKLPPGMVLEDLVSYGCIGLMEAWWRYDPDRGVKFTTFAHWRVHGAMITGINEWSGIRPYRTKVKEYRPRVINWGIDADEIGVDADNIK